MQQRPIRRFSRCFVATVVCAVFLFRIAAVRADGQDTSSSIGLGAQELPAWLGTPDGGSARQTQHWYGWQTLLVDGAALAAITSVAAFDRGSHTGGAVVLGGLGAYAFGAPIVHATHGHWGTAFGSFGLRAVPFALTTAALSCWEPFGREPGGCSALETLAVISALVPIVLDPALFAYEPARVEREPVVLAPWVSRSGGAGLTVGREF
jgi:hypothetical protein